MKNFTYNNKKNKIVSIRVSSSSVVPSSLHSTGRKILRVQRIPVLFILLLLLLVVHCVVEAAFMSTSSTKVTSSTRSVFNSILVQSKYKSNNCTTIIKPILSRMNTFTRSKAQKQDNNESTSTDNNRIATTIIKEEIYNIKNGMWSCKKEWNWGSAIGTGHDCAKICRNLYKTKNSRQQLVQDLYNGYGPYNFEEIKLVLGLVFQNSRNKYQIVLQNLVNGKYEQHIIGNQLFIKDLIEYYPSINPSPVQLVEMTQLILTQQSNNVNIQLENENDTPIKNNENFTIRRCCSLILDSIQFIPNGL